MLWAAESILLPFAEWIEPTTIGRAFIVVQAIAVAGFAEAQYVGLRASREAETEGRRYVKEPA